MRQQLFPLPLKNGTALIVLLSVLFLWCASATHFHGTSSTQRIQSECQLCVTANMHTGKPVGSPLLLVTSAAPLLSVLPEAVPRPLVVTPADSPRAPPSPV